jgi:hypothetical protein
MLVQTALYALIGTVAAFGISLALSHPIITIVSAAITGLMAFLNTETGGKWIDYISEKFEWFAEKVKATIDLIKQWAQQMDDAKMKEREGKPERGLIGQFLYDIASPKNKARMDMADMATKPSHQGNGPIQFTITQNISGDNALAVAEESKRKMMDFIIDSYPGIYSPVVN